MTDRKTVAVILAGGVGSRVGMGLPKQLLKVAGLTIIEHTIRVFSASSSVDEIIVMMAAGHLDAIRNTISTARYPKVRVVLEGGTSRNDSTRAALEWMGDRDCNVLFHDAVRPLVDDRIIRSCVDALKEYEAVDTAVSSADTIIEVKADQIVDVPDRDNLRRGQTPQGFRLSIIREAYARAFRDEAFAATDDCSVVHRYMPDVPIRVVRGSEQNMKVTGPLDVYIIEKLFQLALTNAPAHRSATVLSEKLKNATVVVFGGSYGIGREVADLAKQLGAQTYSFGRSTSGTHIESRADVAAALSSVHAQTGRIDYVVNAAGVLHVGRLDEADDDEIFNTLGVNFLGPILIAQESLPYLSRTGGQLLLFSSSSYTRGRANYSLYSSLKAAVVNLVQALGDEWSSAGVRVNCIVPDRTATPMRMNAFGAEPAESLLAASEVARTTLEVLASDLTGKAVEVKRNDPLLPHVTSLPTGVVPAS